MANIPWFFIIFLLPYFSLFAVGLIHEENVDQNNSSLSFGSPVTEKTVALNYSSTINPSGDRENKVHPNTWVADLFYNALWNFSISKDVGNTACRRQTEMYIRHLKNNSYWAVQMSDSWSRYPTGLLVSTTHQMGVYDECVGVHRPVQGKYCMPSVKLETATNTNFSKGEYFNPEIHDPAWREILGFVDYDLMVHRNTIKFSVCIPDSCSAKDLQISLQEVFNKTFLPHQVKPEIKVDQIFCSTDKDMYPIDRGFYLASFLVGLIILICCLSTAYHLLILLQSYNGKKMSEMPAILSSFSMISNGKDLIKFDKNNNLNVFNGVKTLAMAFVLFGHKFLYTTTSPIVYGKRYEQIYENGPDILLTCMNLVDIFFYIAGYLMYALLLPQFRKPGTNWCQIPLVIFYKYLRTLPPYLIMMLLTAFVLPHMGSGPFWASKMWPEAEKCRTYWWANIIAISNFIEVDHQCLIVGWYISCLLQFLVIGTIIIYVYAKNRKLGIYIMIILLVLSMAASFVSTYIYDAYGIIRVTYSFMQNPSNSFEYRNLYRSFYLRGTPFYAGLLTGVVVYELKKREIKFSQFVVFVGSAVISVVAFWIQLYPTVFYKVNRPYNVIEQSIHSVLTHCTWTSICVWCSICHFTTGYGPLEKLLNNRLMVFLGRLSYSVYLVNITVILMIEGKQKSTTSATTEYLIDGWIYSSIRIYAVGLFIYFIAEAPFGLIIRNLVLGTKKDQITNNVEVPTLTNSPNVQNGEETDKKDSSIHL